MQGKRPFQFRKTISIGDLITVGSVIIAALAVLMTWRQDQAMRKQAHADRIRNSAGTVIAKLERWRERYHYFYGDILPLLVQTTEAMQQHRNFDRATNLMYRGIVAAHTAATRTRRRPSGTRTAAAPG